MYQRPPTSVAQPISRPIDDIADIVLNVANGTIVTIVGASSARLLSSLENSARARDDRLALFVPLKPATTAERNVEQVLDLLADTALRMWPVWFSTISFDDCGRDTLGREATQVIARRAVNKIPDLLAPWAQAAVALALGGLKPRVSGTIAATEFRQLCLAINRAGLILIIEIGPTYPNPVALVHAMEWMSRNAHAAIVTLLDKASSHTPPFDRILHGAIHTIDESEGADLATDDEGVAAGHPWLVPVCGIPHPLSETEQRLARALGHDEELAPLFAFNQFVDTLRGHRPKVDLLWRAGRLVVELDGYADHGRRRAFIYDRHRDYELTLSGYTVLRLANEEIAQDIEKAVEKIRDLVRLCRTRTA